MHAHVIRVDKILSVAIIYAFYLFSGLALIVGAFRLQMGDTGGFAKCMGGAAMLCLPPYFASEISSLFNI